MFLSGRSSRFKQHTERSWQEGGGEMTGALGGVDRRVGTGASRFSIGDNATDLNANVSWINTREPALNRAEVRRAKLAVALTVAAEACAGEVGRFADAPGILLACAEEF